MEKTFQTREELLSKLEEVRKLKEEVKKKLQMLETNLSSLNDKVKDVLNLELTETQKYTFRYAKLTEVQVNSLEKLSSVVRHYYELLKDLTEKEVKIILEIEKLDKTGVQDGLVSQEQLWLALSKLSIPDTQE